MLFSLSLLSMPGLEQIKALEKRVQELSIFHQVGKTFTATLDLKEVLSLIMGKIGALLRAKTWSLLLIDSTKNDLYFQIAIGKNTNKIKGLRIKVGQGLAGWVAQTGKVAIVKDVSKDPRFLPGVDNLVHVGIRSAVCMPLKNKGRTLGVIELVNCFEETFPSEDLSLLKVMADYAAIAINNATYVKRVQELTIIDDCTSLYNSRYFNYMMDMELSRSKRYNFDFALILFDLDRFKNVNDIHGHLCGTRLLHKIGGLVKLHLRDIDTAYRYGGDEFILLLPQTSKQDALKVARRLCNLLAKTSIEWNKAKVKITASFGVVSFPDDASNKIDLIRLADQAMYRVKKRNCNNVEAA